MFELLDYDKKKKKPKKRIKPETDINCLCIRFNLLIHKPTFIPFIINKMSILTALMFSYYKRISSDKKTHHGTGHSIVFWLYYKLVYFGMKV